MVSNVTETQIQFQVELFDTHGGVVNLAQNRVHFPMEQKVFGTCSFTWN